MLMMSAPVEAKMHAGKTGASTEASQSGYDMTGKLPVLLPVYAAVAYTAFSICIALILFLTLHAWQTIAHPFAGTKHRGLKPGQRKDLMASAREEADKAVQAAKKATK